MSHDYIKDELHTIIVSNLNDDITENDLREFFYSCGKMTICSKHESYAVMKVMFLHLKNRWYRF